MKRDFLSVSRTNGFGFVFILCKTLLRKEGCGNNFRYVPPLIKINKTFLKTSYFPRDFFCSQKVAETPVKWKCLSIDIFICSWLCLLPILFESLLSNPESLHVYFQSFPCPVSRHMVIFKKKIKYNFKHIRNCQKYNRTKWLSFPMMIFFGYVWSMKLLSPHFFLRFYTKMWWRRQLLWSSNFRFQSLWDFLCE